MNERDFAIMEAARNEAVDAYFNARPQLQIEGMNVDIYQKLFEAGFTRAWDKVAKLTTERDELRAELEAVWNKCETLGAELCKVNQQFKAKLEGGVRVYAKHSGTCMASITNGGEGNATLLIDDGVDI